MKFVLKNSNIKIKKTSLITKTYNEENCGEIFTDCYMGNNLSVIESVTYGYSKIIVNKRIISIKYRSYANNNSYLPSIIFIRNDNTFVKSYWKIETNELYNKYKNTLTEDRTITINDKSDIPEDVVGFYVNYKLESQQETPAYFDLIVTYYE